MQRTSILVAAGLLMTATVWAGPEHIIKQRAKDVRDQNNASQGVPPRQQAAPAPAPAAARPATAPTASQAKFSHLQASMNSIKAGSQVAEEQRDQLALTLMGDVSGPNKLSLDTANKLARSLSGALSEKLLTTALRNKLAQNIHVLLNAQSMNPKQTQGMIDDIQKSLETAGVSTASANLLSADLLATATELQKPKK